MAIDMAPPLSAPRGPSSHTYRVEPASGDPYQVQGARHELVGDWHVFVDEQGHELHRVPSPGTSVRRLPSS